MLNVFQKCQKIIQFIIAASLSFTVVSAHAQTTKASCSAALNQLNFFKQDEAVSTLALYNYLLKNKVLFGKAHSEAVASRAYQAGYEVYIKTFPDMTQAQKDAEGLAVLNIIKNYFDIGSRLSAYGRSPNKMDNLVDLDQLTVNQISDLQVYAKNLGISYQALVDNYFVTQNLLNDKILSVEAGKIVGASIPNLLKISAGQKANAQRLEDWKERKGGFYIPSSNDDNAFGFTLLHTIGGFAATMGGIFAYQNDWRLGAGLMALGTANVVGRSAYDVARTSYTKASSVIRKSLSKRASKKTAARLSKEQNRKSDSEGE